MRRKAKPKTRPKARPKARPKRSSSTVTPPMRKVYETPPIDRTTDYARGVASGAIVACRLVMLACKRHLEDLKHGKARGLTWRADIAEHRINFYPEFLRHSKGEWARQPVELSPWQCFVIGSIFGWQRADKTRRFRVAYQELPRKNGKSTILAGVGLNMLVCDFEEGGEVYAAATKRDQARIIFDEARRMVLSSPDLAREISRFKLNLSVDSTNSKFEPLSSDNKTADGLNPHCVLVDELHRHKSRELLDVLDTAFGSRRQPLLWIITTAGDDNPESVYAHENAYAIQVLEGVVEDDSYFAFIATIDKDDDWKDPKSWAKANPNLGISVKLDDLQRQAKKAEKSPGALDAFKRLRLNVRTSDTATAIDMVLWNQNSGGRFDPDGLVTRDDKGAIIKRPRCWGGLDLSSKIDITAYVKLFEPDPNGVMKVVARFWMPADILEARADKDRMPYRRWVDEGWIEATLGNVIDHDEIKRALLSEREHFNTQTVCFDPWNATQLATECRSKGIQMVEFIQGLRSYTAPTKELQALLQGCKIDHGDNPVLRLMASNLKIQKDKNLNEMPHKQKSIGRIDGMCALIMAIGGYTDSKSAPQPGVFVI